MYQKYMKRVFDVIASFSAMLLLSPLFALISLLVRMMLGKPVLFLQKRPGYQEKLFILYKFRTMTDQKDDKGKLLPDERRITRFGKLLRSTSMDELPELFNVLKGDMSLVGPRPLLLRYLPYYTEEERKRSLVKPGITGPAQISGRNALSWEERFRLDLEYVKQVSFLGDLKILLQTLVAVLKRKDILVGKEHVMEDFDVVRKREQEKDRRAEPQGNKAVIRYLTQEDLIRYESILVRLLEENMQINFPEYTKRLADDAYEPSPDNKQTVYRKPEYFHSYVTKALQDMKDYQSTGSAILIGAFSAGRIIGFLWAYRRQFLKERRIHISHIIVNKEERSGGVGSAMLLFLEEMARKEGITKLELVTSAGNEATLRFYAAKGFLITRHQLEKVLADEEVLPEQAGLPGQTKLSEQAVLPGDPKLSEDKGSMEEDYDNRKVREE